MSKQEIEDIIVQGEGQNIEFKDSRILSNPVELAIEMAGMANVDGGVILLGVRDNGSLEGMKAETEHERHVMNIATDRCDPPIRPRFEKVNLGSKGDVYYLRVPRRERYFHGVKLEGGLAYYLRVGSTVRAFTSQELHEKIGSEVRAPNLSEITLRVEKIAESRDTLFDRTSEPYRSITITPIEPARSELHFSGEVDSWLYQHKPRYLIFGDPRPAQDGVIFKVENGPNTEYYATVTKDGSIYYGELIPREDGVHIGRTIMVVGSMLKYAEQVYVHFPPYTLSGKALKLMTRFKTGNAKNQQLTTDPGRTLFRRYIYEDNELVIMREHILDELRQSRNSIVESIIEEFCRSFGFSIKPEVAKEYVASVLREAG